MKNTARRAAALLLAALQLALVGCGPSHTARSGTDLEIYCFSAGKADAFLLQTAESTVLIDTGEKDDGKAILSELSARGIDKLDCLILTHFDKDHIGGAARILDGVEVEQVFQSNCPKASAAYDNYQEALEGAGLAAVTVRETLRFTLDGVTYIVDPPRQERYDEDESNNSSLIVTVENGDTRLLFLGDAQDARLEEFLSFSQGRYDFLKMPYHGHWQETLPELLERTHPTCAVITSSDAEPEDEATLELLERCGTETCLTREGAVIVRSDGERVEIACA